MNSNYQICSICVMDTSDQKIIFDENGVCDHCNNFYEYTLPNWQKLKSNPNLLDHLSAKIKGHSNSLGYNCIIGVSGGADSSYLVHLAVTKMKLKPLLIHVDGGWNSQIANNNIEKLVESLNLDLHTEVINWKEMRDLQLAYFKSGVSNIDVPQDHAFFASMYKFADKYNIKHILTGANLSTECIRNPIEWMYFQSDSRQLRDIHNKYGSYPLKTFPLTNILWHKIYLRYFKKIEVNKPLDYFEYDKTKAMDLLEKEYGWMPYPQKHFESRFTTFYESYWLPKKFGYDVRRVQLSSLILTKQIKRENALKELSSEPFAKINISKELEFVSNKLEINLDELLSYLKIPNKTYKDYKSNYLIYKIGTLIMKLMKLELGGKR